MQVVWRQVDNNKLTSLSFINQKTYHLFHGIKELYLEHNQLAQIKGIQIIQTSALQRLTLNNNLLTDQQTNVLGQIEFGQLRALELQKNKLNSVNFIYNQTLSKLLLLSLSQNGITHINFASAKFLPTLYKLQLSSNQLASSFIGICRFQNLQQLDLSKNKIVSGQGLRFLELNQNLQKLKLSNNLITIGRFLALLNCKLLTDLQMRQNFIVEMSSYMMRRCQLPRMNTIFLTKNWIEGSLATEIIVGLNKNEVVNLSLWSRANLQHKISSYMKMKQTFKKLAFYDY